MLMLDAGEAGCSRAGFAIVEIGAPHSPQKRLPEGISALHFWQINFNEDAQFRQM